LQHIFREADLAEFTVADHVDASLALPLNHFCRRNRRATK
jgi:hypothetical protein